MLNIALLNNAIQIFTIIFKNIENLQNYYK